MDGKGRAIDNILRRLWRTVKYENVYLQAYTGISLYRGLKDYFEFYNTRLHQSLDYGTL
jgi:putative transposase